MSKVNVFITVDTEHSIGGAFANPNLKPVGNDRRIFYRAGGKDFGISMIMDTGDHFGIRISFFLETLNKYYFGEKETREVCQYIVNRGHDVQLHLHPNFLNFTTPEPAKRLYLDMIHSYSLEKQTELIAEGKADLIRYGAPPSVAFRAGNFGADRNTLIALQQNGFLADSSYNRAFLGHSCKLGHRKINDVEQTENIWEFPVTNFLEKRMGKGEYFRPLDINGVSFAQICKVLEQAQEKGPFNITVLLHSFSFIEPADVQYTKMRPRWMVIRRFRKLCEYLDQHRNDFQVMTFGELDRAKLRQMKSWHHLPKTDSILYLQRNMEQIRDILPLQSKMSYQR